MSSYEFHLPDIGEGLHEAEIVKWLVKVGDDIKVNDDLVEIQTDKAVVEITSPISGKVESLGAEEGDTLKVGEVLVYFSNVTGGHNVSEEKDTPATQSAQAQSAQEEETKPKTSRNRKQRVLAAPSVRKAAREAGIDLTKVTPTGTRGRIIAKDLQRYMEEQQQVQAVPKKEEIPSSTVPDKEVPITGLRKIIFENMQKAVSNAVLCSGMDDVNVTKLVDVRKNLLSYAESIGVKLTYLPFIVKAVSSALKNHPIFNASVNEEAMTITYHQDIHIGIAMATEAGLIVPVIRHADQKSIIQLAQEIEELSKKAQDNKLSPAELTGSTFTISSTGAKGGWYATPIINYPEVAILGVHSIKKQPIVVDDEIKIGHMMGMSITFDHRIIDGEPSGQFMSEVAHILNTPEILLLHAK